MHRVSKVDILNGPIAKQLMLFFFPILLGSFFQQIYNTTDAIIVGNFVGTGALAAVGGTPSQLMNAFNGFAIGVASGASVIVAQYFGSRNSERLSKAVHTAIAIALCGGILFTVLMLIFSDSLLTLLQVPADIMDLSSLYLRIVALGFIASLVYNMGTGILRAVGDTKRPLYFLVISCVINIILDIILVVGFKLAIVGVAVATVISQIISAVLVIVSLVKSDYAYQLCIKRIKLEGEMVKEILHIGIPAGCQSLMYSVSNIIIQSSINFLGTSTVAAWTTYGKLDSLFWMMISAFGVSITTFAAQNFGAGNIKRVKKSITVCMGLAFGVTCFVSIVLYFFGSNLYGLFTSDAEVIEIGTFMLKMLCPFYFTYIAVEVIAGALRGIGDSIVPVIITGLGVCAVRVVWVFTVVNYDHTLFNVILCYPITWILASVLFIIYYIFGHSIERHAKKSNLLA